MRKKGLMFTRRNPCSACGLVALSAEKNFVMLGLSNVAWCIHIIIATVFLVKLNVWSFMCCACFLQRFVAILIVNSSSKVYYSTYYVSTVESRNYARPPSRISPHPPSTFGSGSYISSCVSHISPPFP
jgi:hypothetical protein